MLRLPFFDRAHHELVPRLTEFSRAAGTHNVVDPGRDFIRMAADAGILQIFVASTDLRSVCLAREIIAGFSGFADAVLAVQGLGTFPVAVFGSTPLVERYIQSSTRGETIAAFAVTEPEAGSDISAIETTARRDGDVYVISGRKTLISNAGLANMYIVFARAEGGLSAFAVDADTPGFRVARQMDLIAPHPVGELEFNECRVPASNRLGAEGEGMKIALTTLDFFRPSVGAAACGIAERALKEALAHAQKRKQFGSRLVDFQATRMTLADMATELDAARLLVYRAAWLKDSGTERITREASIAKLFATEAAQRTVDRALQIHGGAGLERGAVVERLYREVRALRIYEGTSEIQRLIIAKDLCDPQ
jgi:acyl-CoA dehydrogenase